MKTILAWIDRLERWAKGSPKHPPVPIYEAHKGGAEMVERMSQHVAAPPADYAPPVAKKAKRKRKE